MLNMFREIMVEVRNRFSKKPTHWYILAPSKESLPQVVQLTTRRGQGSVYLTATNPRRGPWFGKNARIIYTTDNALCVLAGTARDKDRV